MAWSDAHPEHGLEILELRGVRARAILAWVAWPGALLGVPVRRYVLLGGVPTGTTRRSLAAALLCRDLRWGWGATTPLLVARTGQRRTLELALDETLERLRPDLLQMQGCAPELAPARAVATSREANWVAPSGGPVTGRERVSKRSKKRLLAGLEALAARPGFSWSVVTGAELKEPDVAELEALELKSRKAGSGTSILTSGPGNRAFLQSLLRHEPSCRVGRLRVEGGLVAWALGLRAADRGEGLLLAHDPAFDAFYPGLLAYLLVEEALDREAPLTSYSLGRGRDWWKTGRLLAKAEPSVDLAIYGASLRGKLLRVLHSVAIADGQDPMLVDPATPPAIERAS